MTLGMGNCDCSPCQGICSFYNQSFEATSFVIGTEPGSEWTVLSGDWDIITGKYLGGYNDGGQIEFDYTVGLTGTDINSYQVAAQSLSFDFYAEENDVFSFKVFGNDEYTIQFNMLTTGSSGGTGTVEILDGSTVIRSETHDGDPAQWNTVVICWAEVQDYETSTEQVFCLHIKVTGTVALSHYFSVTKGADPSGAVMPTDVVITSENDGGSAHFILFDNFEVAKNGADCPDCDSACLCSECPDKPQDRITVQPFDFSYGIDNHISVNCYMITTDHPRAGGYAVGICAWYGSITLDDSPSPDRFIEYALYYDAPNWTIKRTITTNITTSETYYQQSATDLRCQEITAEKFVLFGDPSGARYLEAST